MWARTTTAGAHSDREQLAGFSQEIRARLGIRDPIVDAGRLFLTQAAELHQRVDEDAERRVGGEATGGRVVERVPGVLEVGEDVPDGGRREVEAVLLGEVRLPTGSPVAMNSLTTA